MSELFEDIVAIERGTMSDEEWLGLCRQSHSWGGHLVVEGSVETEPSYAEEAAEGRYATQGDFIHFATGHEFSLPSAIKAYRGLFRIYDEQQAGLPPLAQMRGLRFEPEPEYTRLGQLFERAGEHSIEIESLHGFMSDIDDAIADCPSGAARLRFQARVLPRMIGIGTIDLYRSFVDSKIDKS